MVPMFLQAPICCTLSPMTTKRKRGRPARVSGQRTTTVGVRLTDAEAAAIRRLAKLAGITTSDQIRKHGCQTP